MTELSSKDDLKPHPPSPKGKGLIYIGAGAALPDVPARDLTSDELDDLQATSGPLLMGHGGRISFIKALIDSGLYKEA